jgi:hypothetical protein
MVGFESSFNSDGTLGKGRVRLIIGKVYTLMSYAGKDNLESSNPFGLK